MYTTSIIGIITTYYIWISMTPLIPAQYCALEACPVWSAGQGSWILNITNAKKRQHAQEIIVIGGKK